MKISGQDLVNALCDRLERTHLLSTDNNIVRLLCSLPPEKLNQLVIFGDVVGWHNERINSTKNNEKY